MEPENEHRSNLNVTAGVTKDGTGIDFECLYDGDPIDLISCVISIIEGCYEKILEVGEECAEMFRVSVSNAVSSGALFQKKPENDFDCDENGIPFNLN